MARTISAAVIALIVGGLLGLVVTMAAVGLLPFAVCGTLTCSVNSDGTISTCVNDSGQQVKVPHHIRIQQ